MKIINTLLILILFSVAVNADAKLRKITDPDLGKLTACDEASFTKYLRAMLAEVTGLKSCPQDVVKSSSDKLKQLINKKDITLVQQDIITKKYNEVKVTFVDLCKDFVSGCVDLSKGAIEEKEIANFGTCKAQSPADTGFDLVITVTKVDCDKSK